MANYDVRLHEFNGKLAIHFADMPTIYLSPQLAEKLSKELKEAAIQLRNGFHYPTKEIKVD